MGFSFYIHTIFKKAELSLQLEHEKSNKLLENILPLSIIQKLRENPDSIAEKFSSEIRYPNFSFFSLKNKYKLCMLPLVPDFTSIGEMVLLI